MNNYQGVIRKFNAICEDDIAALKMIEEHNAIIVAFFNGSTIAFTRYCRTIKAPVLGALIERGVAPSRIDYQSMLVSHPTTTLDGFLTHRLLWQSERLTT